jgi:DNA polymerase I-like protein with 3'-5' exonuclease and polymerase domains
MNTRFQATGADMCKQALVNIYNYIHQNNLWGKVKFMLQVHDSIMMQVVEDYAEEWLEIQKQLMVQVNEGMLFKVVVGVDGQLTKYWKK